MKKTKNDYLRFIDAPIYQDDEMFCVNSDTIILGMFLDDLNKKKVLDIGTNNGALLIYAGHKKAAHLTGIDINEKAVDLALENLHLNNYLDAEIINTKVQDFKHEPFDVIVCNPPFFKERNQRFNAYKSLAMFEGNLSLEELFINYRRLLKDNGAIYTIYPANRFAEFYNMCLQYKFKIMRLSFVYDTNKDEASRFVAKLKKGSMTSIKILKPFYIDDGKIIM